MWTRKPGSQWYPRYVLDYMCLCPAGPLTRNGTPWYVFWVSGSYLLKDIMVSRIYMGSWELGSSGTMRATTHVSSTQVSVPADREGLTPKGVGVLAPWHLLLSVPVK